MTPNRFYMKLGLGTAKLNLELENCYLEVTGLEPGIVKVTAVPNKRDLVNSTRSLVCRLPKCSKFECYREGDVGILKGDCLETRVDLRSGLVIFNDGKYTFAGDVEAVSWEVVTPQDCPGLEHRCGDFFPSGRASIQGKVTKQLAPDECLFGFGERMLFLDRRGNRLSNWSRDPSDKHTRLLDNMYQVHPVFLSVRPGLAWGIFLASSWYSAFDAAYSRPDNLAIISLGGRLEYYLIYGPDPAGFVDRLTLLTGRPFLPPLWALGYHQSRWGYKSAAEIRQVVKEFRRRGLPLDAVHFDIDYMDGYRVFTFDRERFPDPRGLIQDLNEQGVQAVLIVDPGIRMDFRSGYQVARRAVTRDMVLCEESGAPYVGYCWPDAAVFPDFSRPDVRAWWGDEHKSLFDLGVSGIWNDMNEPSLFDQPFSKGLASHLPMPLGLECGPGEAGTIHAEYHNLYGLDMCQATWEGFRKHVPDKRPWILSRSGFTGIQRLACVWTGDNSSWWEHLELSVPQLLSMGICGVAHCGADIGGFSEHADAELFVRWFQLGMFYPFARNHSACNTRRQEPWCFGEEVESICRKFLWIRYRLLPYIYTLAHLSHRSGAPIMRPMFFDFFDQPEVWPYDTQFMLGPQLLIAPVVRAGHRHKLVMLPQGGWYDFYTGKFYEGGEPVVVAAPLDKIPIMVRAGSVLTLGNARISTSEPVTELTLKIYPGSQRGQWTLIEDDGISFKSIVAETTYLLEGSGRSFHLKALERQGSYSPNEREVVIHLVSNFNIIEARLNDRLISAERVEGGWQIRFVDSPGGWDVRFKAN